MTLSFRLIETAAIVSVALLTCGCGSDDTNPVVPSPPASLVISSSTPASGSTLMPIGTPPGTFFTRGSGQFGVTISITAGQELPFAQLAVFLMTADPTS